MILAILQARMSSSRLPGKVLKKINNKPILQYEIERILQSKYIDKLVIATSTNKEDDEIENFAKSIGIECYRGDLDNVLKRYYDCALYYKADIIVRVTGDCPVIDPEVIDAVIETFKTTNADYASNTIERTFPDGLDVEVFSFEILKKVYLQAKDKDDLEHVTKYIYTHPEQFKIVSYKNDIDYSYIRWTLDTIDDFHFFKSFYEKINNTNSSWRYLLSITNNAKKYLIDSNQTIRYAMKKLEEIIKDEKESLYVIEDKKIIGTLSSSDVRRSLIYGNITNNDQVVKIINKNFHYLKKGKKYTKEELIKLKRFKVLPLLDDNMHFIEFKNIEEMLAKQNRVVLMAGGLGSRLKDLTKDTPKPMLKIAGKPILEIIIEQFKKYYFNKFYISVDYKAEQIIDYFGNGDKFGANIKYLQENKKLGTAGCLSLIEEEIKEPIFLVNGDILTNINFEDMLNFHNKNNFDLTIAAATYSHTIPYGMIISNYKNELIKIEEKPTKEFLISGGVYIINPSILKEIPKDEYYDITDLFNKLLDQNQKIGVYKIDDYWIDIGHPQDFYQALYEYENILKV